MKTRPSAAALAAYHAEEGCCMHGTETNGGPACCICDSEGGCPVARELALDLARQVRQEEAGAAGRG